MTISEITMGLTDLVNDREKHNLDMTDCWVIREALERIKLSLINEYGYEEGMKIYSKKLKKKETTNAE